MDVEQAKLDAKNLERLRQTIAELYGAADQVEAMGKQLWLKIAQQLCDGASPCKGDCWRTPSTCPHKPVCNE